MLRRILASASIAFALSILTSTDATATAQRTFVSTGGVNNPACSLVAPCRDFATAIAAATAGGEVIVLDSGGYGTVTINQSVSIIAPPGVYAGLYVPSGGSGVAIAAPGANVVLRGLTINSSGSTYGVLITDAKTVSIEGCVIANHAHGIEIEAAATIAISSSVIHDNIFGIVAGFGAMVNVANSLVQNNPGEGIFLIGGPAGSKTRVAIVDTVVSGSDYCLDNEASAGATGYMTATRVTLSDCYYGVMSEPNGSGTTTVGNSTITTSSYGFYYKSGLLYSLGNNLLTNNLIADTNAAITTIGGM